MLFSVEAWSQAYPVRPVRLVTPSAPGSTADLLGRMVAQKLAEAWGQSVVVDARAGAAGIVASGIVAKAPADGYTLIVVAGNHAINPSLYAKLPYDTGKDFAAVTQIGAAPLLVAAHPGLAAASMRDLIAYARTNPGRLIYASAGKGTPGHLVMELLSSMAKIQMLHVPYSGGGPVLNAVVSGEAHMLASGVLILLPLAKAGKLKALAVTSQKRSRVAPDVPTIAESGVPGFSVSGWWGVLAPAATPKPILSRVQRDIAAAIATSEVQMKLANDGVEPVASTSEQFDAYIRDEMARWARVVKDAGIRPD
jgi:tripartite-type tricarboxylate transporter receptor subunit TctC